MAGIKKNMILDANLELTGLKGQKEVVKGIKRCLVLITKFGGIRVSN